MAYGASITVFRSGDEGAVMCECLNVGSCANGTRRRAGRHRLSWRTSRLLDPRSAGGRGVATGPSSLAKRGRYGLWFLGPPHLSGRGSKVLQMRVGVGWRLASIPPDIPWSAGGAGLFPRRFPGGNGHSHVIG
jgi:hypothetical protein